MNFTVGNILIVGGSDGEGESRNVPLGNTLNNLLNLIIINNVKYESDDGVMLLVEWMSSWWVIRFRKKQK